MNVCKVTRDFKIELPDGETKTITATASVSRWTESHGEKFTTVEAIRIHDREWEDLKKAVLESLEKCDSWFYE